MLNINRINCYRWHWGHVWPPFCVNGRPALGDSQWQWHVDVDLDDGGDESDNDDEGGSHDDGGHDGDDGGGDNDDALLVEETQWQWHVDPHNNQIEKWVARITWG